MTSRLNPTALDPDKSARQLSDYEIENEALGIQVEVLKAHLQSAEQHIACQERKVTELSTRLETETKENMSLLKQVEDLVNELQRERASHRAEQDLEIGPEQQASSNLELATELKAEKEASRALKEELKAQEEKTLVALMAVELLVEEEVSEDKGPEKNKKSSLWKRIRHFFGLRRRENRRRERESTSNSDSK